MIFTTEHYIKIPHLSRTLKSLPRSGWVRVGVSSPESVASHSWRVVLMAMIVGDILGLDVERMLRMAVLHDLAEAVVGDITPVDGVDGEEKRQRELEALEEMFSGVPGGEAYLELWREFEMGDSAEARAVRELDKLEMALQAVEYGKEGVLEWDVVELFLSSAREAVSSDWGLRFLEEVEGMRGEGGTRGESED